MNPTLLTIDQALALVAQGYFRHGLEPCEGCGDTHSAVWSLVDFDEDSDFGQVLRALRDEIWAARELIAEVEAWVVEEEGQILPTACDDPGEGG